MSDLQHLIDQANVWYEKGMAHKNVAIKSDENLKEFLKAEEAYLKAAHFAEQAILADNENFNFTVLSGVLKEYYLYEAAECKSGFEYKHNRFDQAIKNAQEAEKHIKDALKIIDDNFSQLKTKVQEQLAKHKQNWTLSSLSIQLRVLEPTAKRAMLAKGFMLALDTYRQLGQLQDKVYTYTSESSLAPVYKRTEEANFIANKASVAMSLAGVYLAKPDAKEYDKEVLEQFLIAYKFSKQGLTSNPEQYRYKEGVERITENISQFLKSNKGKWLDYLIEFKDDPNLKIIMQKTDNAKYKKEQAKIELENNGLKKFFLIGSFWIGLLFVVFYILMHLAESNMVWYRFLAVIFAMPILITVIGAFTLRSTDGLKEENFIKLMTLALKINLQGLKVLNSKSDNKP